MFPVAFYDQEGQGNIYFVEEEESGIDPDSNYESNTKNTPNALEKYNKQKGFASRDTVQDQLNLFDIQPKKSFATSD